MAAELPSVPENKLPKASTEDIPDVPDHIPTAAEEKKGNYKQLKWDNVILKHEHNSCKREKGTIWRNVSLIKY